MTEVSPRAEDVHVLSPDAPVRGISKVRGRGQVNKAEMCHPGQPEEQVTPTPRAGGAGRSCKIRHSKAKASFTGL